MHITMIEERDSIGGGDSMGAAGEQKETGMVVDIFFCGASVLRRWELSKHIDLL